MSKPIVGLKVVNRMQWDADEQEWNDGKIYDPETGNTYNIYAKLKSDDILYIKGYIGFSLIGRSTTWKRVD